MISFINSDNHAHSLSSAISRLFSKVLEHESSEVDLNVDFDFVVYGHDSSPLAQNDSEEEVLVKALVVGLAAKRKMSLINTTIDKMVDSYGLTDTFEAILADIKI